MLADLVSDLTEKLKSLMSDFGKLFEWREWKISASNSIAMRCSTSDRHDPIRMI